MLIELNLKDTTTSERLKILEEAFKEKYKDNYTNYHLNEFVVSLLNEMAKATATKIKITVRRYGFVMKALVYDISKNRVGFRISRWTSKEIGSLKGAQGALNLIDNKDNIVFSNTDTVALVKYIEWSEGKLEGATPTEKLRLFINDLEAEAQVS